MATTLSDSVFIVITNYIDPDTNLLEMYEIADFVFADKLTAENHKQLLEKDLRKQGHQHITQVTIYERKVRYSQS